MLRANPRVLSTALFSALGLLPLACGGAFSGVDGEDGGGGSGGSANGGSNATGGKASAGSTAVGGSKSMGGSGTTGGSVTTGGEPTTAGRGGSGGSAPCNDPIPVGPGYERCGDGPVHRPSVEECTSSLPRPPVEPIAAPGEGQCLSDADCTAMPHGYCEPGIQVPGPICAYGCVKDSECGEGQICVCGEPVGHCAPSTCTSDADCGAGLRCQSYDGSHGCGIHRFACQTPDDTCESDADCMETMAGTYCDATSGTFTCVSGGCAIGRPFLVEGAERVAAVCRRSDWCDELGFEPAKLPDELAARVSRAWLRIAQMEHASVAAFARFALQLLQLGAPPHLVERATAAMADETRHAKLAFGVASAYAGQQLGPAALDVANSLTETSLVEVVRLVVREGCIGETVAALEAREAALHAGSPRLAELLGVVADDETRHAELAWCFVGWALEQSPDSVAQVVRQELERAAAVPAVAEADAGPTLLSHGIVPPGLQRELQRTAFREVIAPCAAALLARAGRHRPENPVLSA